jgi:hypothetical protein
MKRIAMKLNNTTEHCIQRYRQSLYATFLLVAFMILILLSACSSGTDDDDDDNNNDTPTLLEQYQDAIVDAMLAEDDEIYRNLVVLSESNPDLEWDNHSVLVVTWTDWTGYDSSIGDTLTLAVDVWVTTKNDLFERIGNDTILSGEYLDTRLQQLLGLPPYEECTRFAELWAPASAIFRPAYDPDPRNYFSDNEFPAWVSSDYRDWFDTNYEASFPEEGFGYPWTQLGYTYDWGNPVTEVGCSEFVIPAGTRVRVEDVRLTEWYISNPNDGV